MRLGKAGKGGGRAGQRLGKGWWGWAGVGNVVFAQPTRITVPCLVLRGLDRQLDAHEGNYQRVFSHVDGQKKYTSLLTWK